jgi:hypothetical protein
LAEGVLPFVQPTGRQQGLRRLLFITAALLAVAGSITAAKAEEAGFSFLRVPLRAVPAALGEATVAMAGEISCAISNPGALPFCPGRELSGGFLRYIAGIQMGNIAYIQPLGASAAASLSLSYLNSGDIKQTTLNDPTGECLGFFGYSSTVLQAGFGRRSTERLSVGAGVKLIYEKTMDYTASGGALDLGCLYRIDPSWVASKLFLARGRRSYGTSLVAGFSVNNIGVAFKPFAETRERLPLTFRAGLEYRPFPDRLVLLIAGNKAADSPIKANLGAEFNFARHLALRAGYNGSLGGIQNGSGMDDFSGLGLGFGVRYERYRVDCAYTPYPGLGHPLRVDISAGF